MQNKPTTDWEQVVNHFTVTTHCGKNQRSAIISISLIDAFLAGLLDNHLDSWQRPCQHQTAGCQTLFGLVFRWHFCWVINSDWDQRSSKNWSSFSFGLSEIAETKLRAERSLNPKLINSPVDFVGTRQVDWLEIKFWWTKITFSLFC